MQKTKLEMFVGQKLPDEFLESLPSEFEKKRRKEDTKPNKPGVYVSVLYWQKYLGINEEWLHAPKFNYIFILFIL